MPPRTPRGAVRRYTVVMDLSRPATAGSDFTTLTTVPLLASFVAGSLALAVAGPLREAS